MNSQYPCLTLGKAMVTLRQQSPEIRNEESDAWVHTLPPLLTSYCTLGKKLSARQFPHL